MLAERGLDVSYETVRRWFLKFAKFQKGLSADGRVGAASRVTRR